MIGFIVVGGIEVLEEVMRDEFCPARLGVTMMVDAVKRVRHPPPPPSEDAAERQTPSPALEHARSVALWQQGPTAVGDYLLECWVQLGMVEDWRTDGRLWELVDAELHRRFEGD